MGTLEYDLKLAEHSARIGVFNQALGWYKSDKDQAYIKNLLKLEEYKYSELISDNIPF